MDYSTVLGSAKHDEHYDFRSQFTPYTEIATRRTLEACSLELLHYMYVWLVHIYLVWTQLFCYTTTRKHCSTSRNFMNHCLQAIKWRYSIPQYKTWFWKHLFSITASLSVDRTRTNLKFRLNYRELPRYLCS